MSYPNILYGTLGDEKKTYSAIPAGLVLGQEMRLKDGRIFRLARASTATAVVPGKLYVHEAGTAGHGHVSGSGLICPTAVAVGDTTIVVTCGATGAITADQYAGGWLAIKSGNGAGHVYKIKSHTAAATTVNFTVTLEPTDKIAATIAAGTTTCSLRTNEFQGLLLRATGTAAVGINAGVPPVAASAGHYFWIQRRGTAAVLQAATVGIIAQPVVASTAVAGALGPMIASTTNTVGDMDVVGHAMNTGADAEYIDVYLELE